MLIKLIRLILGKIILTLDALFTPTPVQRSAEAQAKIDQAIAGLVIYEFEACPFCVKVRRFLKRMNLKIEFRDASKVPAYRQELVAGGGKYQVPCLRIPEGDACKFRWLYESSDIIEYLQSRLSARA